MKLKFEPWLTTNKLKFKIIKAIFEKKDIEEAKKIALAKFKFTNPNDPSGNARSDDTIYNRHCAGKLADFAVKHLINKKFEVSGSPLLCVDYDEIRTDNFKEPDLFDLAIYSEDSKKIEIEVRSSFCYRIKNPQEIINKMSIIGPYTASHKLKENPHDWYFQFYWHMIPESFKSHNIKKLPVFEEAMESNQLFGFIVGAANVGMLNDNSITKDQLDQGAEYKAVFPVSNGMDPISATNEIYKLVTSTHN